MSRNNLEVEITKCGAHLKALNSEREGVKNDCKFPVANRWVGGYCLCLKWGPQEKVPV